MWPFKSRPIVPVLKLNGPIGMATPLRPGLSSAALAGPIEKAFTMSRCPAVALIVNSPGGSPVQSSLILKRIRQMADEKRKQFMFFVRILPRRAVIISLLQATKFTPMRRPLSAPSV